MPVTMHAEKLGFLIGRRFPDHWKLRQKELPDGRVEALMQYETELANLPRSTIDEQYVQAVEEHVREQQEAEERADRLEFFNQPDAAADFRFWCDLEEWSLEEATALFLSKDPRKVSANRFTYLRQASPFRRAFEALRSRLDRAVVDGKLGQRNKPSAVVDWAKRVGVAVPGVLSEQLETAPAVHIDRRELATLHRLIIGMATKFYGYDASASRSPIPTRIVNDLADFGLELSPETVRTHLREASKLLPSNANKKELR